MHFNPPPPTAPQLQNTGIWPASPTMICHTSAYRSGEFLNQGCVYDDQGAQLVTAVRRVGRVGVGEGERVPAEKFVTVHGRTGDITDAATGKKTPVTSRSS
ncbi:hypothetical protein [Kribbella sp. NPDC050469]